MDPQLKSQLKQTVYIASVTGADLKTGEPSYGTPLAHAARVTQKNQKVLDPQGVEVLSNAQVVVEGSIAITDRIWLPGADKTKTNNARYPKQVANAVDERGNHDYGKAFM